MSQVDRKRQGHVVLPRRLPGLSLLEHYFPSPADNQLDAELIAFARPGDTVLDPWAGTGWTARRAIAHGMRVVAADPSPFAQLAAQAFLLAPDLAAIDAAFSQLAASRRVDVPLRQHIEELYATRCAVCRRPAVGEQFIWPRDADAPGRKVYRCSYCDTAVGGPQERVAAVDDGDLAKLGIDRAARSAGDVPADPSADVEEELPPAPIGLTGPPLDPDQTLAQRGEPPPLPSGEPEPPSGTARAGRPRFASTVHPDPAPASSTDARHSLHYEQLRDRFPVLDGRHELVEELLDLYTPRNLYALQAIATKIEAEFRDPPLAAIFRLALAACLLPGSRLNGYPGRVASLRISAGHVRQPASRHQREVNVWRLFEAAVADVRTAIAAISRDRKPARFAADLDELGGVGAANVLWIRSRPAVIGQYLPVEGIDLVLGAAPPPASADELSFEYLATAWLLGREAAETLRLEPLFSAAPGRGETAEATAIRHAMASAAGALKPDGWYSVLLDGPDPERMLAVAVAGAAAALDLVDVVPRESVRSGDGVTLHFHKPSAEDRLRQAVQPDPLRLGEENGRLTYPELAEAIERSAGALLRNRGEPAGLLRIAAAVLVDLEHSGLLKRLASARGPGEASDHRSGEDDDPERLEGGGAAVLSSLLREELSRDDHPTLLRVPGGERATWWLRQPALDDAPLADRVEWATFSLLTTAGKLDEAGFLDRIFALFPGVASPDEELVRACLAAYAVADQRGQLRCEEELGRRQQEHARMLGTLIDYAHRLELKAWVAKREQDRPDRGVPLGQRLVDEERRAYLPLIVRAPAEALAGVDAIWYRRGSLAFLFDVEWTAMLGEAILQRGVQIGVSDQQARFFVFPAERTDLLRLKVERSPWLQAEIARQNCHFLKWQHLETMAAREGAGLDRLEPVVGLDPLIERGGEQLTMFGE